ncbi:MAG: IS4 family transposase [Bacteroidota bacterium]
MAKDTIFTGQPIFTQLLSFIPRSIIGLLCKELNTDHYYKKFKTYDHLVAMLYASFHRCSSLREVTTGLMACQQKLSHLGLSYIPRRSTLSDANRDRKEVFFAQLYDRLYKHHYGSLPDSLPGKSIDRRLFLIDSTTISLFSDIMKGLDCKPVNGKRKGGAKAHLVVKADQDIPCFSLITHGSKNDRTVFKHIHLPQGAIAVFDKGYDSYKQMQLWDQQGVFWVTRLKENAWQQKLESSPVSERQNNQGVISDSQVLLGRPSNKPTPKIKVRRIEYKDPQSGKVFTFITNHSQFAPGNLQKTMAD